MNLHELKPNPGAKHRRKRLGCGESSGLGKTSGRGHKGQKSRSGGGVRPGFEGGQMPLHRRLPKKGFSNVAFRPTVAIVNVAQLNERFEDGDTVSEESRRAKRLARGRFDLLKVLRNGVLERKMTVKADAVSASAKEKNEKAGGSVEQAS